MATPRSARFAPSNSWRMSTNPVFASAFSSRAILATTKKQTNASGADVARGTPPYAVALSAT